MKRSRRISLFDPYMEGDPSTTQKQLTSLRSLIVFAPLRMTLLLVTVGLVFCFNNASAQRRPPVEYYRSPFGWAVQADPLGYLLGRYGGRVERRLDPTYSVYLDYAFDRDLDTLKTTITNDRIPAHSAGVGGRIYLRDNAALEGLFAGASVAGTIQNGSRLGLRLSTEIGYKWMLGDGPFFIEPQLLIDAYPFRDPAARAMFTYIAIPVGFAWK